MSFTKTITGTTITSGYVLGAKYVGIIITGADLTTGSGTGEIEGVSGPTVSNLYGGAGVAGGVGLSLTAHVFARNHGVLIGGAGGFAGFVGLGTGPNGGVGGAAVSFAVGGYLFNDATITGGNGGKGGSGGLANGLGGAGGAGVALAGSGSIVNSGHITAGGGGVGASGGTGAAVIGGAGGNGGAGIYLANDASVTNSGTITGGVGGVDSLNYGPGSGAAGLGGAGISQSGVADVLNSGLIQGGAGGAASAAEGVYTGGAGGAGVYLLSGGSVVNLSTISGGLGGLNGGKAGSGAQGDGVDLFAKGGQLTNGGSGNGTALIAGAIGVYADAGGAATVVNYGTIKGVSGVSVEFGDPFSDRLVAESGSTFIGTAVGGSGTLELAGGTGTIAGLGGTTTISGNVSGVFASFETCQLDAGGSWTLSGANSIGGGQELDNRGTLTITPGANLTNGGQLRNSGQIDIGGVAGKAYAGLTISGAQQIAGGGTISLGATGYIGGVTLGDSLTNVDNTIVGGGFIRGPLALTNDGTIDNSVGRMVININDTVINNGRVESTGTGNLLIRSTTIDSSGGGLVFDSHRIQLDNGTLLGGSLTVNTGALLISSGAGGLVRSLSGAVINLGTIEASVGGLTIDASVDNSGLLQAYNGALTIKQAVSGTGKVRVVGAGVLEIDGALGQNVFMAAGSTGTVVLGDTHDFTGRIYGFSNSGANHIELKDIAFDSNDKAAFSGSTVGGTLTITNGATIIATLKLTGNFIGSTFTLSDGGANGTIITDPPKVVNLTSAMAGFGAAGSASTAPAAGATAPHPLLASPSG